MPSALLATTHLQTSVRSVRTMVSTSLNHEYHSMLMSPVLGSVIGTVTDGSGGSWGEVVAISFA